MGVSIRQSSLPSTTILHPYRRDDFSEHQKMDDDELLLARTVKLMHRTFRPVRSAKPDGALVVLQSADDRGREHEDDDDAAVAAIGGVAASALLTELRMCLGLDVTRKRETLGRLVLESLHRIKVPLRPLGSFRVHPFQMKFS